MLIYGYNIDKQLFYIADAFKSGKYSFETCTFMELYEAVNNLTKDDNSYMGFNNSIELLSLKEWDELKIYPERIKESLTDYCECKLTKYWYTQQFEWQNSMRNHLFGLDCYKIIYNELNYIKKHKFVSNTGWLSFHVIWEHKNVMVKRLICLNENNILKISRSFIHDYLNIERKALICRNMIIKYTI